MNEAGEGSLISDLVRETCQSWRVMSTFGKVALLVGTIAFAALPGTSHGFGHDHPLMAGLRITSLLLIVYGVVENARGQDEFYGRVHLEACAFAVIVSSVALYALAEFGVQLGTRSVSVVAATYSIGFVIAFARLRRA